MASNLDTLQAPTSSPGPEVERPDPNRRHALTWVGVAAACGAVAALAVVTLTGGDDGTDAPSTRFDPQVEQRYEHEAHLGALARTYGRGDAATADPTTTDAHDGVLAGSRHVPVG